ncbi:MAG: lipid-A-disaccharide synthase-related protein, partial [Cyanobacteria bacterium P01_C01_bin.72]
MKLLVLSNGHGEDIIAIRIIERLLQNFPKLEITALPIVGRGYAYQKLHIPLASRVQQMPSGGFIYQGGSPLWQDIRGGLLGLTLEQIRIVRQWGKTGSKILAVGDIVPLLYAWLSDTDYAFVGTAKSEYYLRDESGWLPQTSWQERKFNSVYLPWERWLMSCDRCRGVFPRDSLTTEVLQQWSIPAYDLGNPMMDGLFPQ